MALMKHPKATSFKASTRASKSFSTGWYDWKEKRRKPARIELATIMCPSDASNTLTNGESPSSSLRRLSPRLVVTVVVVIFFAGPSFTTVVVGIVVVVVVCMGRTVVVC